MAELSRRTLRALAWSGADVTGQRLLQLVFSILIARLLFPDDFGLMGMLAVFIGVGGGLIDGGFSRALIQHRDPGRVQASTVLWVNLLIGGGLLGTAVAAAPLVASFFGQAQLAVLLYAMSLLFLVQPLIAAQTVQLTRDLDFRLMARMNMLAILIGGCCGWLLAHLGFGVWSLVAQHLASAVARAALLWLRPGAWRPMMAFDVAKLGELWPFASRMMTAATLNATFGHLYEVAIGKAFGADPLGLYTRARQLAQVPAASISGAIGGVALPVMASLQDDPVRLQAGMRRALIMAMAVNAPMMVGLAAVAEPMIEVLLTERWLGATPYLQLLAITGLLFPLQVLNLNLLQGLGRADWFLRLEVIKQTLTAVNIGVTWQLGLPAMVMGQAALSCVAYALNTRYSGRLIDYPLAAQVRDAAPYVIAAAVMGSLVWALGSRLNMPVQVALCLQVLTGILVYIGLIFAFRMSAFDEFLRLLRQRTPL